MSDLRFLNAHGRLSQRQYSRRDPQMPIVTEMIGKSLPSHLFLQPAVVEVVGAGFDRPSNARFLTLRFPRIVKVHLDRSPGDALGYDEYQRLAQASYDAGDPDTTYGSWLSRLDPESEDDVGATTTQSRASESQESDSSLYNVASAQVDRTTGIKRRASSSPVHSSAVKKSWRRGVATTALGEAYTLSIGESNPMEIPDS